MGLTPKSFSASALTVAESCISRYYAENILRAPRPPHRAADLGTAVHAALEVYVKAVHIDKVQPENLMYLITLYRMHFMVTFDTVEPEENTWYAEGLEMIKVWFARTDFSDREVLSVETKTNFMLKTSLGEIPFNYIFDRMDRLTGRDEEYEIVDYKTIRKGMNPADLKKKIQARVYGLAGQIQFPNAKRIWVRFDLLRHDSVATVFTRDENIATWKFAKALAEKIIATSPDDLVETLNAECTFCVRKAACSALKKNVAGGGLWSVPDLDSRINLLAQLTFQRRANDILMGELEEMILQEASAQEQLEFETELFKARVTQSSRRTVDAERVQRILPPDVFFKYGGHKMNYGDYTRLMKDQEVPGELKEKLKQLVYRTHGDLRVAIDTKNPIDG
jgi:RecB family exonuclease